MGERTAGVGLLVVFCFGVMGCGGADKRAAGYMDKARMRFEEGDFGKSVANYDRAIEIDKKGKLSGVKDERQMAVHRYVLAQLKKAWDEFDRGDYEDAHDILLKLHVAGAHGDAKLQAVVVKALGDLAAVRMKDAEAMADNAQFLPAVELADFLVKPLPADHVMRERAKALRNRGVVIHQLLMKLNKQLPGWVAFNYLVAKRLGGERMTEGIEAVREAKRSSVPVATHVQNGRNFNDKGDVHNAVNSFILSRAVGPDNQWDSYAAKYFQLQFGIRDDKLLEGVWDGDDTVVGFKLPDADSLPAADYVSSSGGSGGSGDDDDDDYSGKWRLLAIHYGLGTQLLDDENLSSRMGADVIIPGKSVTHEPGFHVESSSLGGGVSGWGVGWKIHKGISSYGSLSLGIGYWASEQSSEVMDGVGVVSARSLSVPIGWSYPVSDLFVLEAEFEANIFKFSDDVSDEGDLHYHTASGRISLPLPLLPKISKIFRNLWLEGYAIWDVEDAAPSPDTFAFGGQVIYRRSMSGGGDDDDDDDDEIIERIKDSPFVKQTIVGPTIDVWYELGTGILDKDNNVAGMGTVFRIPTPERRPKTVIEPSVWFWASGLGGGIGGWGIQYLSLKPLGSLGVFGYGIGYMANSQSDSPFTEPTDPLYEQTAKQRAFYIPLVIRRPIASSLAASLEFRGNLLQLGGHGTRYEEHQAFSPLILRAATPLPVLGSLGGFFRKLHIEGKVQYTFGAENEVTFGGALVWRPIIDD